MWKAYAGTAAKDRGPTLEEQRCVVQLVPWSAPWIPSQLSPSSPFLSAIKSLAMRPKKKVVPTRVLGEEFIFSGKTDDFPQYSQYIDQINLVLNRK